MSLEYNICINNVHNVISRRYHRVYCFDNVLTDKAILSLRS